MDGGSEEPSHVPFPWVQGEGEKRGGSKGWCGDVVQDLDGLVDGD